MKTWIARLKETIAKEMQWKVLLLCIEFRPRHSSLLRYFLVQKGLLLPRHLAVAIRVDSEENFGIPRNFIGTLSVSLEARKALSAAHERFPSLGNFYFVVPPTWTTRKSRKNVRWGKKSTYRDLSLFQWLLFLPAKYFIYLKMC